jgi:hypothetical protein
MAFKPALAATLGLAALSLAACGNMTNSASRPTGTTSANSPGVGFSSPQPASPMSPSNSQSKGEGGTGGQGAAGGGSAGSGSAR